jgi:predicted HicB family RNase H-like nuclease
MKYKGYLGIIEYDAKAKIIHGQVMGLKDIITFQGSSVQELEQAFHDSVDDYLNWCKDRGEKAEKTFSGRLNLRIPSKLHEYLAIEAAKRGMSLNDFINYKLNN